MPIEFSILWIPLEMPLETLSAFVIILGLWSAGFKNLTKYYLNYSLSSIFWILINPFLGRSNSLGNFI